MRVPLSTLLVGFFMRAHVRRGVEALDRRLSAERALGGSPSAAHEEAVKLYADAVPPTHARAFAVAFAASVLVLGRLAVQYAGEILSRVPELTRRPYPVASPVGADRPIAVSHEAQQLMRRLGESLTEGVPSPSKVVDALLSARLGDVAVVAAAVSLAVYAVLRPWVPAFRFKRMLLNVHGDMAALHNSTLRWSNTSRTGVFADEETVFRSLRARPPREFPFDLAVSGLLCVVPIGLGAFLMTRAGWEPVWNGWLVFELTVQLALLLVLIGAARIAWLVRTWRRRRRGGAVLEPPFELRLADGHRVIARDPLGAALTIYLLPQAFPVWLAVVVRDLHRVQRARGGTPASILKVVSGSGLLALIIAAVAGLLLLQVPVPTLWLVVPVDTPLVNWLPVSLPWSLTYPLLGLTAPTVVAYGQLASNRVLRQAGTPIPEGPR